MKNWNTNLFVMTLISWGKKCYFGKNKLNVLLTFKFVLTLSKSHFLWLFTLIHLLFESLGTVLASVNITDFVLHIRFGYFVEDVGRIALRSELVHDNLNCYWHLLDNNNYHCLGLNRVQNLNRYVNFLIKCSKFREQGRLGQPVSHVKKLGTGSVTSLLYMCSSFYARNDTAVSNTSKTSRSSQKTSFIKNDNYLFAVLAAFLLDCITQNNQQTIIPTLMCLEVVLHFCSEILTWRTAKI